MHTVFKQAESGKCSYRQARASDFPHALTPQKLAHMEMSSDLFFFYQCLIENIFQRLKCVMLMLQRDLSANKEDSGNRKDLLQAEGDREDHYQAHKSDSSTFPFARSSAAEKSMLLLPKASRVLQCTC
ncbi:hypothetical protein T4D_13618 [Trichinella pseudospiralis]|uniref:Uncharacterized protein n=1 Tax=Trichinella pseudospiralis TaxID=6337 RepID=A0A0V1G3Y0_TRIPS|nr:hypothetical protein T4D_13618 [Trichinella pseudospiralis]